MPRSDRAALALTPALAIVMVTLAFASLLIGRSTIPPADVIHALTAPLRAGSSSVAPSTEAVVIAVRMPRILAAILVGGALAVGGSAYQTLFRNPLVSPSLLGVSAGSALGATLGLLLAWPRLVVLASSFAGGLFAVSCTLLVTSSLRTTSLSMLVLAGIVTSTFFEALVSFVKYAADPIDTLPAITFWLLGGLGKVGNRDVAFAVVPIAIALVTLWTVRWPLTVMGMGDDEARALGVPATRVRIIVIVATTLLTAPAVGLAGIIGWIGLLVPHAGRMLVGARFQALLPVTFLMGGILLLAVDDLVRCMPVEVPLGAAMALVGAPGFVALLIRHRSTWL
ncbi:MAG: iron ABC transporter permease [Vicinamibacterales bacterium]